MSGWALGLTIGAAGSLGGFYATNFRDLSEGVTAPQEGRELVACLP
jgi:hypothetical protein